MSNKVSLPDGEWAILRTAEEVPNKLRKPLLALQRKSLAALSPEIIAIEGRAPTAAELFAALRARVASGELDLDEQIEDRILLAFIADWSFPFPVSLEGIDELPTGAVQVLKAECNPLVPTLLGQVKDEDVLDPTSPTAPANGSDS